MKRIFVIGSPGTAREKLEELLDSSEVAVIGRSDDLDGLDEELAAEAEVIVMDGTTTTPEELLDSLQETRILRNARVVLLMDQAPPAWVNRATRAGVRAILPTQVNAEQLTAALEAVSQGLLVTLPAELRTDRSAGSPFEDILEIVESLTARERDVLQMLSAGLGNREIAARLKISEHTAKFHVASILGKLGASTRTEAVTIALRRGLILI